MIRNPFSLVRHLFINPDRRESEEMRRDTRVISGTPTEFVFCNRRFGAVIIDASNSGMQLSCAMRLGIGSIITLAEPAISGKIVWRDDKNNLMGIIFVNKESRSIFVEDFFLNKQLRIHHARRQPGGGSSSAVTTVQ